VRVSAIEVTARVAFVGSVNQWTKAGIMIRQHNGPQAAHASLFVTPTVVKGIAFQRRRADLAASVHAAGPALTAPVWLKLVIRSEVATGTSIDAYYRDSAGGAWLFIDRETMMQAEFNVFQPLAIGFAVTSHVDGRLAEARFDNFSIRELPGDWRDQDIGSVGITGSSIPDDTRVTLEGSGADIWGTADAFHYRYRFGGLANAQVTARVMHVDNTNPWAKAGVMMRQSLTPGSPHVMLIVSPGRGVAMQYRESSNGITANVAIVPGTTPKWLRLKRTVNAFIGEISNDGVIWQAIGSVQTGLEFGSAGVVLTSHNNRALARAEFEDLAFEAIQ
jgi:hypothetical protein